MSKVSVCQRRKPVIARYTPFSAGGHEVILTRFAC